MKVAVIGTGHVGLVTCVALASVGHQVAGTDSDEEKIAVLQRGGPPFYEPGLDELLSRGLASGGLTFGVEIADVVPGADVVFICVGTPPRADGDASLLSVERSAREIARHATGPVVVAEKSTVPVGTAVRLRTILHQERPELDFEVVSNPEFLREGRALLDSLEPDRILVGAETAGAFGAMRRLYEPFTHRGIPLIETDLMTAELAKHACNAFLALKVSFANAMARICERAGADVVSVADIMGADPRIGRAFLDAGLGYGGFCFPKDLAAFERLVEKLGGDLPLLREIARINDEAVQSTARTVQEALWNLEDKRVALFGLAFKPDTDDVRFAPALALARLLLAQGAHVLGYDPKAAANAKAELPELEISLDPYEAAAGANCVVVCTEWDELRALDLGRLKDAMAHPVVVDGRNLFDPKTMGSHGFTYYPTGRPPVIAQRAAT
ncbi:MAG TPA: UDP-glucose/GDP-mannose dehydrogenase family protein [Actinomycetota bacterium]|nr:UDP-glucose/GDP-mannose dehydrogenase family protein [Actinomycetota bacterium]